MNRFALIGAAGFIAPRHMKAIKDTGSTLLASLDPKDSVGVLDSYFPDADFFTEFERFDRHIDKLRRKKGESAIDYISICSPNYLHDSHIRFALRSGADAICEKPLVLNHWNIDALQTIEKDTGRKVYTVLQLRMHPSILALKQKVANAGDKKFDVSLAYVTARGKWYFNSWKGDISKSGGIITNIGIHFFDMLYFVFGKILENKLHYRDRLKAGGFTEFEKARVRWFLSIDNEDLPPPVQQVVKRTYRNLVIDDSSLDFSEGFSDLHTRVYEDILAGNGFGVEESRMTIETVSKMRTQLPIGLKGDFHPLLKNKQS